MGKFLGRAFLIVMLVTASGFGQVAPSFHGDIMGGSATSLRDQLKPHRALLLCFWASWCIPCMEEMRLVSEKIKADASLPLDILSINVDTSETSVDVRPAMRMNSITVPVILDPQHQIFSKYHEDKSLPFSVLIDSHGQILQSFSGYHEELFQVLRSALAKEEVVQHAN